jgi:hypothetical protein
MGEEYVWAQVFKIEGKGTHVWAIDKQGKRYHVDVMDVNYPRGTIKRGYYVLVCLSETLPTHAVDYGFGIFQGRCDICGEITEVVRKGKTWLTPEGTFCYRCHMKLAQEKEEKGEDEEEEMR